MKIESIVYLNIGLLSAGLVVATVVALIHRRAVQLATGRIEALVQATRDLQTVVEQLRNETNTRIVEMQEAINTIKVEFVAMDVELASKAPPQKNSSSAVPKVTSSHEDTWTRHYSSADFSIVPNYYRTNDDDSWPRDESASDATKRHATALSEGHLSTAARPGTTAQPPSTSVLTEKKSGR
jgi:hypothetical protein